MKHKGKLKERPTENESPREGAREAGSEDAFTPKEFAKLFHLHYMTVLRWCNTRPQLIKGLKMGKAWRIPYEEKFEFPKRQQKTTREYLGG